MLGDALGFVGRLILSPLGLVEESLRGGDHGH